MDYIPKSESPEQLEITHLSALYQITTLVNFSLNIDEVLEKIIDQTTQVLGCSAASLMTIEESSRDLKFKVVKGEKAQAIKAQQNWLKFQVGKGISGWVAERGQSLIINDPGKDERFNRDADLALGFNTINIICVPLILKNRTIGIIELLNKKSGDFTRMDLEFLHTVAGLIGMAMDNARLFNELNQAKNFLNNTIENMPGGFITIDLNQTITTFNLMAAKILQVVRYDFLAKSCRPALVKQFQLANILLEALESKQISNRLEVTVHRADGQEICLGYGTILIKDNSNNVIGVGIIFQDLTELRKKGGDKK